MAAPAENIIWPLDTWKALTLYQLAPGFGPGEWVEKAHGLTGKPGDYPEDVLKRHQYQGVHPTTVRFTAFE